MNYLFKFGASKKKPKLKKMQWQVAHDVKKDAKNILSVIDLEHVDLKRVYFYRSYGSRVRAYARTWMLPKIFQLGLNIEPVYGIEVLSEHYDKLNDDLKKSVIIHELLHIPKNFSGALASHKSRGRNLHKNAKELFNEYLKKR